MTDPESSAEAVKNMVYQNNPDVFKAGAGCLWACIDQGWPLKQGIKWAANKYGVSMAATERAVRSAVDDNYWNRRAFIANAGNIKKVKK
jgi:hypothetical protein